jgi:hypothetical protein
MVLVTRRCERLDEVGLALSRCPLDLPAFPNWDGAHAGRTSLITHLTTRVNSNTSHAPTSLSVLILGYACGVPYK